MADDLACITCAIDIPEMVKNLTEKAFKIVIQDFQGLLKQAGMRILAAERHDDVMTELLRGVGHKLSAAIMVIPGDLGVQLTQARELLSMAMNAVGEGILGYALVSAAVL